MYTLGKLAKIVVYILAAIVLFAVLMLVVPPAYHKAQAFFAGLDLSGATAAVIPVDEAGAEMVPDPEEPVSAETIVTVTAPQDSQCDPNNPVRTLAWWNNIQKETSAYIAANYPNGVSHTAHVGLLLDAVDDDADSQGFCGWSGVEVVIPEHALFWLDFRGQEFIPDTVEPLFVDGSWGIFHALSETTLPDRYAGRWVNGFAYGVAGMMDEENVSDETPVIESAPETALSAVPTNTGCVTISYADLKVALDPVTAYNLIFQESGYDTPNAVDGMLGELPAGMLILGNLGESVDRSSVPNVVGLISYSAAPYDATGYTGRAMNVCNTPE